jgi:DNA-binding CsgD family transcriptional regulator
MPMNAVSFKLTPRDTEILSLIMDGYSARLIGEQLSGTVLCGAQNGAQ